MKPRSIPPLALAAGLLASVTAFASPHGTPTVCSGGADEMLCSGFDGSGSTTGPDLVYGNLNNFLAAIAPGYYQNDFHDANGPPSGPLQYSDPVSGIAYTVDSTSPSGLWNWNGVISTNSSADHIVVTFTGTPVTAIGGNFWTADSKANPNPGFVAVITLSDGTTATLTSNGPDDFRGFTATQPIASISIDAPAAPGQGDNVWAAMDNLIVGSSIPDVVYDNLDDFLAATAPGYYQNDFHDANGPDGPLQYSDPVSGIAYTVDASSPSGLWNWNGVISTNSSGDQIVVTFTGTPVTAIGGNFFTADSSGNPNPGFEAVITLSDGTTATLTSNGPDDFRGFTTPQPIASISIDAPAAPGQGDNIWAAMDNLIVGSRSD